ncbi:hypothetical protein THZB04_170066 [Vibrio owensii]|nr:hypothetical protein THZB04_170066 [Vibrio owensii]
MDGALSCLKVPTVSDLDINKLEPKASRACVGLVNVCKTTEYNKRT